MLHPGAARRGLVLRGSLGYGSINRISLGLDQYCLTNINTSGMKTYFVF